MFSKFDEQDKKVLINMQKEMIDLKHPYVGSEHLLLSLLKYGDKDFISVFNSVGIDYGSFKNELIKVIGVGSSSNTFLLYTPLLRNVLESASLNASDSGKSLVETSDLFISLFEEGEGVAIRVLIGMGVDVDDLYDKFFNTKKRSKLNLSIDTYGINLNELVKSESVDPVICRDKEISRILEILSRRTKNNPLLLGDAGVGKTAIVEELARRISIGDVPPSLLDKRIVSVSMASLVAGTKYRGEFEEKLTKIITELEDNKDIILFVDEFHTLVGAGGAEGAIDASNILKPALARGNIKIIGATTISEYKEFIEKDRALSRRFQNVYIKETSVEDTINILKQVKPIYEKYHNVSISDNVIEKIVLLSNKYIHNRRFPDKAIDVLDEVCSKSVVSSYKKSNTLDITTKLNEIKKLKNNSIINNNFDEAFLYKKTEMILEDKKNKMELKSISKPKKKILLSDVYDIIESMSKVPILNNVSYVSKCKKKMMDVVKGQSDAINSICDFYKKKTILDSNKPISFLFAGPTGVGKTLLAKEFGKYFYGNSIIRVDMSEYKESHSISKMIGSPPGYIGYNDDKNIFEKVKDNPYSLIILDEIEKGSKEVVNLFLQILDEGYGTNSKGEKIDFSNTAIIMTSNLGCNRNNIGFDNVISHSSIFDFFGDEFVNRIGSIIYFNKIDLPICKSIVLSSLNAIRKKYKDKGLSCSFSNSLVLQIVNLCNYDKFGARKINFIISDKVESIIANKMISGINKVRIDSIKDIKKVETV